mmetsp:Transcript_78583/g.127485  ORF Transcript_78583/g.127485 Transcript_78583/m.127485 type:complete len:318 (+) Transcript_78583:174-1127(+)
MMPMSSSPFLATMIVPALLAAPHQAAAFTPPCSVAAPRALHWQAGTVSRHDLHPHALMRQRPLKARVSGFAQTSMLLGFPAANSMALATVPVMAVKTAKAVAASANPLVLDCMFAGLLYVLGKMTSSAFAGEQETLSSLTKWFTCGLVDGWACHAWYAMLEFNFGFMPVLQQTIAMNSLSSAIFTPAYCGCFLVLLSLLEWKGLGGAVRRVGRDWKDLAIKSVQVWSILNIPLFLCVPLHLRVVVSMAFHYVYLVGLGLWDAKARRAAAGQGQYTAWGGGEDSRDFAQPALNLALAKVPLDNMDSHYGYSMLSPKDP